MILFAVLFSALKKVYKMPSSRQIFLNVKEVYLKYNITGLHRPQQHVNICKYVSLYEPIE